MFTALDKE